MDFSIKVRLFITIDGKAFRRDVSLPVSPSRDLILHLRTTSAGVRQLFSITRVMATEDGWVAVSIVPFRGRGRKSRTCYKKMVLKDLLAKNGLWTKIC